MGTYMRVWGVALLLVVAGPAYARQYVNHGQLLNVYPDGKRTINWQEVRQRASRTFATVKRVAKPISRVGVFLGGMALLGLGHDMASTGQAAHLWVPTMTAGINVAALSLTGDGWRGVRDGLGLTVIATGTAALFGGIMEAHLPGWQALPGGLLTGVAALGASIVNGLHSVYTHD